MDKTTLKALKGSIRKWQKIVDGTGKDKGEDNCPLCKLFFDSPINCKGCPVEIKTGRIECAESPYADWDKHLECSHNVIGHTKVLCKACIIFAKIELAFLKSLLPKEKT